jgi:hypothetical protein
MQGRNPRYGRRRRGSLKAKLAIAAAVVVGGGAIGLAVATTTSQSPTTAASAGYTTSVSSPSSLAEQALTSSSSSATDSLLAKLGSVKDFAEFKAHGKVVAIQRGVVVLVAKKFIIVKSKNGTLKLWWLSGGTKFADVAHDKSISAGLPTTVSTTETLTVTDAATGTTVKVVIVKTTVEVVTKTSKTTSKIVENASTSVKSLKRGDPALVIGLHANGALHAAKVLFVPAAK